MGGSRRLRQGIRKGSRQGRKPKKQCFCLIHVWILKKNMLLASTKRQVGVSRSNEINVFFKNWQMYGVKTLLLRFFYNFFIFFLKELFFRFFKDVLNKTLTFEVPTPLKMEAENYKKNVIIRKIIISRFGGAKIRPSWSQSPVLEAKMEPSWSQSLSKITKNMDLRSKRCPRYR